MDPISEPLCKSMRREPICVVKQKLGIKVLIKSVFAVTESGAAAVVASTAVVVGGHGGAPAVVAVVVDGGRSGAPARAAVVVVVVRERRPFLALLNKEG